jgi:hypothetical protein
MLPPQVGTDQMDALGPKVFPYLDPLATPKRKVNVYCAFLTSFASSWAYQAVLVTISAIATTESPIGTKQLLSYIEDGTGAIVRPWVWIAAIVLAPLVKNLADQLYMYYNSRTATHIEAAITAVVYRHSLRMRIVNDADDDDSAPGDAESSATAVSSDTGPSQKGQDVAGRLNNLVTSDLESISAGKDWLLFGVNSMLQLVIGSWFFYTILGWSAFVGFGVMILLTPLPAWVSTFMNGVQVSVLTLESGARADDRRSPGRCKLRTATSSSSRRCFRSYA